MSESAGRPRLGVLHAPHGAATLHDIFAAADGFCDIVFLFRAEVASAYPDAVGAARQLFQTHVVTSDANELRSLGLDGVVSFHDAELDHADRIASVLGFASRPGIADPWDKLVQRSAFRQSGISKIEALPVGSAAEFVAAFEELDGPCVLKPRRAASGTGIAFVNGAADVEYQLGHRRQWLQLVLEQRIAAETHPLKLPWLGDFISVETVSYGGSRHHLAVFDKTPAAVVRRAGQDGDDTVAMTGDLTPSRIPDSLRELALNRVSAALDALAVQWRVTHTELAITAHGVEVIEVNGRVGGHLNRLLRLVDGPDLVKVALAAAAGQVVPSRQAGAGYAAGLFMPFPERSGTVRSAVSRAQLRRLAGVAAVEEVAKRGDLRSANGSRLANLTLFAEDEKTFDGYLRGALAELATLFEADGVAADPWMRRVSATRRL